MSDSSKAGIMELRLRPGTVGDAKDCGRIQYEAYKSISEQHNFPPDFPSVEVATDLMTMLLSHPRFYSVVGEIDGRIVGCNFLDERSTVAGIGPLSVDPPRRHSAGRWSEVGSASFRSSSHRGTCGELWVELQEACD